MSKLEKSHSVADATLVAAVVAVIIGLLAIFWLIPEFVAGASGAFGGVNPGFMPRVSAWVIVILGLLLVIREARVLLGKVDPAYEESEEGEDFSFGKKEIINILMLAVFSSLYIYSFKLLGFVLASTVFLAILIYISGYRNKIVLIAVPLCLPLGVQQLLWHALELPLPKFQLIIF